MPRAHDSNQLTANYSPLQSFPSQQSIPDVASNLAEFVANVSEEAATAIFGDLFGPLCSLVTGSSVSGSSVPNMLSTGQGLVGTGSSLLTGSPTSTPSVLSMLSCLTGGLGSISTLLTGSSGVITDLASLVAFGGAVLTTAIDIIGVFGTSLLDVIECLVGPVTLFAPLREGQRGFGRRVGDPPVSGLGMVSALISGDPSSYTTGRALVGGTTSHIGTLGSALGGTGNESAIAHLIPLAQAIPMPNITGTGGPPTAVGTFESSWNGLYDGLTGNTGSTGKGVADVTNAATLLQAQVAALTAGAVGVPDTAEFSTAGAYTYSIPPHLRSGDLIDVIAVGGGSGAGGGTGELIGGAGGLGGTWEAVTLVYGTDIPLTTTTITGVVGSGGPGGGGGVFSLGIDGVAGTATTAIATGWAGLSAAGAPAAVSLVTAIGASPGDITFNGITFVGGLAQNIASGAGNSPGGGGGGGAGLFWIGFNGGAGASGAIWFRSRPNNRNANLAGAGALSAVINSFTRRFHGSGSLSATAIHGVAANPSGHGQLSAVAVKKGIVYLPGSGQLTAVAVGPLPFTDNFIRANDPTGLGVNWAQQTSGAGNNPQVLSDAAVSTWGYVWHITKVRTFEALTNDVKISIIIGPGYSGYTAVRCGMRSNNANQLVGEFGNSFVTSIYTGAGTYAAQGYTSQGAVSGDANAASDVVTMETFGEWTLLRRNGILLTYWRDVGNTIYPHLDSQHREVWLGLYTQNIQGITNYHAEDWVPPYYPGKMTKSGALSWVTSNVWTDITGWAAQNDSTYTSILPAPGLVVLTDKTSATMTASVPFTGAAPGLDHVVRIVRVSDGAVIATGTSVTAAMGTATVTISGVPVVRGEVYKLQMQGGAGSTGTITDATPTFTIT